MIEWISRLLKGDDLNESEAAAAMGTIMRGEATPIQIAGFMVALRAKGETVAEVTGLARAARDLATPIDVPDAAQLLDTCGTGGDGSGSFNISTLAAIVAAGAGARVAKHGNRAASSDCGSADMLEALGVRVDLPPEAVAACIREGGIGFLFAPVFHPSFRFAAAPRRELGVRTVFNILGPLCNPAGARRQALGVPDVAIAPLMADVLMRLGVERALVFSGEGMDELVTSGPSLVIEIQAGRRRQYTLDPAELGLAPAPPGALRGGGPEANAAIARAILDGEAGARRDIVLLNSAAALRAAGLAQSWKDGLGLAAESIDSGSAGRALDRWVATSRS